MYIASFPNKSQIEAIIESDEIPVADWWRRVAYWLDRRLPLPLDNLGVALVQDEPPDDYEILVVFGDTVESLDEQAVYERYARSIDKTVESLSVIERQIAIVSAVAKVEPFNERPLSVALTNDEASRLSGERSITYWLPITVVGLYFAVDNPKEHDVGGLIESIERHGYRDKVNFDKNLSNVGETGEGAFASGNGQSFALLQMFQSGDYEPPRGVKVDDLGEFGDVGVWYIPVEFGLDAADETAARAFVLDHNNLTLLGGAFGLRDVMKMYDAKKLARFTETMLESGSKSVTLDDDDLAALAQYAADPTDDTDDDDDFGDVDDDDDDGFDYKCPHCAYVWKGQPK